MGMALYPLCRWDGGDLQRFQGPRKGPALSLGFSLILDNESEVGAVIASLEVGSRIQILVRGMLARCHPAPHAAPSRHPCLCASL